MIRISQMKMPISHGPEELPAKAAGMLHIKRTDILSWKIIRKSVDARKKPDIYFIYTIDLEVRDEERLLRRHHGSIRRAEETMYQFPACLPPAGIKRPVIIGTGPAGLFCGCLLSAHGFRPILLERGKAVENRQKDVEAFWKSGVLLPDSNVQFGEGGAGAFSEETGKRSGF